jgi:lambda family phage portal protein
VKFPFFKSKKKVQKRAYAGAQFNRLVADWIAQSTSADSEIRGSLPALRARSRQLGRDSDFVRAAFRDLQTNIVGNGVRFQSQVRQQRGGKLNEGLNDEIEALWRRWNRKQYCDVAGKLSFADIERLIIRSVAESGEILIRMVNQSFGGSRVPFALEIIEADMLDDNYNDIAPNGNLIRMGVELDQWSRPVAYYFLTKHPGDYVFPKKPDVERRDKHVRVLAKEIIHLGISERPNQTRYVPWLVSAMIRLRHMGGYEEAEIIFARASASIMGFVETPEGELHGDSTENGERVTEFEPGVFKKLNPGEKVNVPSVTRPGSQFDPFMRAMLRGVASGIGTSYEAVSSDYSQTNYSSSRLALLQLRDYYRIIQDWMVENFHQVVYEAWLDMAVLSGSLNLPRYETNPEAYYEAVKWQPRGWSWVDPQTEVTATKEAIKGGLMTLSEAIAQGGGDFEENLAQRRREIEAADAAGVTYDTDPMKSDTVIQAELSAEAQKAAAKKKPAPDATGQAPTT